MDLHEALTKTGGAASWRRLQGLGVSDHALRAGLAGGDVLRAGPVGYALAGAPGGLVTAVSLGGVASHATAAALHGLALWTPPAEAAVTVPLGTQRRADGVRLYRASLAATDLDPSRPVTSVLRTLLDCGRTLPTVESVVIFDSALVDRLVTLAALHRAAAAARGHGATALRRAATLADLSAGSALESALRVLLSATNAEIRCQVQIAGAGAVDFVLDGWLVVEADGFAFHADRTSYGNDRRRGNVLAERGYTLLRFTWEDVRFRPGWVLAQVERVRARHAAVGAR